MNNMEDNLNREETGEAEYIQVQEDVIDNSAGIAENADKNISGDNTKAFFLEKIKAKLFLFSCAGILLLILGIIMLFIIKEDRSFGLGVIIVGLTVAGYGCFRFAFKTESNIDVVFAKCIDKSRSGYRREYYEYSFCTDDDNTFVIKTAQKEKFKKEMKYQLCFSKTANGDNKEAVYSGARLLDFKLI